MSIRICLYLSCVLTVLLTSCSSEGCFEDTESLLDISLYEKGQEEQSAIDSLTVYGLGLEDSKLYSNASLTSISLPLFAGADNLSYIIINGNKYDTLSINYSSQYNFVSKACGYNYIFQIESVSFTTNRIDTILLINNSVNVANEENLRTFF